MKKREARRKLEKSPARRGPRGGIKKNYGNRGLISNLIDEKLFHAFLSAYFAELPLLKFYNSTECLSDFTPFALRSINTENALFVFISARRNYMFDKEFAT